jgi:hypothetical protein
LKIIYLTCSHARTSRELPLLRGEDIVFEVFFC